MDIFYSYLQREPFTGNDAAYQAKVGGARGFRLTEVNDGKIFERDSSFELDIGTFGAKHHEMARERKIELQGILVE